ncbi:MAG: LysR family transcriptional regulator [Pararhodobacter sp.]|nr:LysR family transcriptional regulator [Pararhodobacter sp.]
MNHPLPPLRLLTAFAAVARAGSLQAAAAELNVTQPAISQAVRQLEDHIGLPLLDRGRRPARPTEAGEALATAIHEGLGRIAGTIDAQRLARTRHDATVTVACSVGVATYWLMPRLSALYREQPDLLVNVMTVPSGAPALAEGIDLAIRYGHGRWKDGHVQHLFDEEVMPVCAPKLRARYDAVVSLQSAPLLHVRSAEPSWLTWSDYLLATGLSAVRHEARVFTNYVQATQAAVEGHGVMLGWRSITGALTASGALVTAGLPGLAPRDAFFLVARSKRGGHAIERFTRFLLSNPAGKP